MMLCGLGFGKAKLRDGTGLCQVKISTIICLGAPKQITTVVHIKMGVCLQTPVITPKIQYALTVRECHICNIFHFNTDPDTHKHTP